MDIAEYQKIMDWLSRRMPDEEAREFEAKVKVDDRLCERIDRVILSVTLPENHSLH